MTSRHRTWPLKFSLAAHQNASNRIDPEKDYVNFIYGIVDYKWALVTEQNANNVNTVSR